VLKAALEQEVDTVLPADPEAPSLAPSRSYDPASDKRTGSPGSCAPPTCRANWSPTPRVVVTGRLRREPRPRAL